MGSRKQKSTRRKPGAWASWLTPVAAAVSFSAIVAAMTFSYPCFAAGIDSRTYTCSDLQRFIILHGFVFISSPAFGDFVVANASYCSGGAQVQLRSVPTTDQPECVVNYCVPADSFGSN